MHIFTNLLKFAADLVLRQYEKNVLLSILYNLFLFSSKKYRYGI